MADELGCSIKAVANAVALHGLGAIARRRRRFEQLYDDDWLRAALATSTVKSVAERIGCSPEAVRAAKRRLPPAATPVDDARRRRP